MTAARHGRDGSRADRPWPGCYPGRMMTRGLLALAITALACAALAAPALALDLNSFRAQHGLKRLTASAALNAKARAHAADMARRGSLDHAGFYTRMRGTGSFAAENVAAGCGSADCVFKLWADSP